MKLAIAAIVKNEVDSLIEWLAFHLAVGASHFLIADNESDDGTRELLISLSHAGLVTFVSVSSANGPPQLGAYQKLLDKCPNDVDLVAFIDADEYFLPMLDEVQSEVLASRPYPLIDWLEECFASHNVSALALNWACFGSNGAKFRDDGLVIERFTQRAKQAFGPNHHFKSVVRPADVERFDNPHFARLKRGHYVTALGQPLQTMRDKHGKQRFGLSQKVVWEGARINHYLVKSVEEFLLGKAKRGSAATPNYKKQREYFMRHDRNDIACHVATELAPKVKQKMKWLQQQLEIKREVGADRSASHEIARWLKRRLKDLSSTTYSSGAIPVERWSLDYPSEQRGSRFLPSGRVVQGWLLLPDSLVEMHAQVRIVAEWQPVYELCYPLEIDRPDVIENVLGLPAEQHSQRGCGFRFTVPPMLGNFRLWLALEDQRWLLQEVNVDTRDVETAQPLKVIEGKQGWLFLDNDTNGSVDQFTGRMRLTHGGLDEWNDYLIQLAETAGKIPWALLVAPSKENVMGANYHVYKEGASGPMNQVLGLSAAQHVVHPTSALKSLGDKAFIPTDTHWTHKGALAATLALAEKLGVDQAACEALFKKDRYKSKTMGGDLGNKLTPKQTSVVEVLTSFGHGRYKTYDNGLPNFGRLLVIDYPEALVSGTCLVFGSSSSYSMFNYLCRIFQRIVFVHSAGNVDPELIAAVAPNYLVAQTNARFVVQVPTVSYCLGEIIPQKCDLLDEKGFEGVSDKRITASDEYLKTIGLLPWEETLRAVIK
ncbi:glycosyltransferase family 2 protein [Halomonas sp. AOP13-D3-9]